MVKIDDLLGKIDDNPERSAKTFLVITGQRPSLILLY